MAQSHVDPNQLSTEQRDEEKRPDNDSRARRQYGSTTTTPVQPPKPLTTRQKWDEFRPSKTLFFWSLVAMAALTIFIGFTWGGWMTTASAQSIAVTSASSAVIQRLAPICVAQFNLDPNKDEKLKAMRAATSYDRSQYVSDQTWATMPGEAKPTSQVAAACSTLLMQLAQ